MLSWQNDNPGAFRPLDVSDGSSGLITVLLFSASILVLAVALAVPVWLHVRIRRLEARSGEPGAQRSAPPA